MTAPAPVSVIMPAYRAEATIGRALASVAAQTLSPTEVVVVDDGSADDTAVRAREWEGVLAERGTALTVVQQNNSGAGAARNLAIRHARQPFLAFLDADDAWLEGKLARTLDVLNDATDLAFVSTNIITVAPGGEQHVMDCARHALSSEGENYLALFRRGFVATSTVVARAADVKRAGGFDPSLRSGQDYDLWLAIAERSRFAVLPEALTLYYVTAGSITGNTELRRRCNLRILRRHASEAVRHGGIVGVGAVLTRAFIIQAEAARGGLARDDWLVAARNILRIPFVLISALTAMVSPSTSEKSPPEN